MFKSAPIPSIRAAVLLAVAGLSLQACSDVRTAIGLERNAPDEFTVVSRAPLTLPPDMRALPPPNPGAPRPQEGTPTDQAAAAVFGGKPSTVAARNAKPRADAATAGQRALLGQASAKGVDPDIRRKVEQETTALIIADKSWVDTLLFWQTQRDPTSMVDPAKEAQRLRANQAEGKAVNDGTVPTIERKRKAPFEGLF